MASISTEVEHRIDYHYDAATDSWIPVSYETSSDDVMFSDGTTLTTQINDLKTYGADVKSRSAAAVSSIGVTTASDADWNTIISNIKDTAVVNYNSGHTDGYNSGYSAGNSAGYNSGYNAGYSKGVTDADNRANGNSVNYQTGYNNGYNAGYGNGLNDGGKYSIGTTGGTIELGFVPDVICMWALVNEKPAMAIYSRLHNTIMKVYGYNGDAGQPGLTVSGTSFSSYGGYTYVAAKFTH